MLVLSGSWQIQKRAIFFIMQVLLEVMLDLCFLGEAFKRRVFYIFYEKHIHGSKRVVVLLFLLKKKKKKTLTVVLVFLMLGYLQV